LVIKSKQAALIVHSGAVASMLVTHELLFQDLQALSFEDGSLCTQTQDLYIRVERSTIIHMGNVFERQALCNSIKDINGEKKPRFTLDQSIVYHFLPSTVTNSLDAFTATKSTLSFKSVGKHMPAGSQMSNKMDRVEIKSSTIKDLQEGTFTGSFIDYLELTGNDIQHVERKSFNFETAKSFKVAGNSFQVVQKGAFRAKVLGSALVANNTFAMGAARFAFQVWKDLDAPGFGITQYENKFNDDYGCDCNNTNHHDKADSTSSPHHDYIKLELVCRVANEDGTHGEQKRNLCSTQSITQ
jgi:hypothetical protein